MYYNKLLGMFLIILGLVLFVIVTGDFLIRIALGLAALYIVNYGMRLRGLPPLYFVVQSWLISRRFKF
jgi:hypothetical protein